MRQKRKIIRKRFEDMKTSEKKQAFFRWLLRKGKTKFEAAIITHRKFYNGDPFIR